MVSERHSGVCQGVAGSDARVARHIGSVPAARTTGTPGVTGPVQSPPPFRLSSTLTTPSASMSRQAYPASTGNWARAVEAAAFRSLRSQGSKTRETSTRRE